MKKSKAKKAAPKKVAEIEWGCCEVCGEVIAWPGANVSCDGQSDDGEACEGVYAPCDQDGEPL